MFSEWFEDEFLEMSSFFELLEAVFQSQGMEELYQALVSTPCLPLADCINLETPNGETYLLELGTEVEDLGGFVVPELPNENGAYRLEDGAWIRYYGFAFQNFEDGSWTIGLDRRLTSAMKLSAWIHELTHVAFTPETMTEEEAEAIATASEFEILSRIHESGILGDSLAESVEEARRSAEYYRKGG